MGPTYAGGTQPIVKDGYAILYLADVANRDLIAQGEAPVFYYVPNQVRMARKDGPDKGDYLFNLVRFAGTGGDGVIGGSGGDVAGGVLTFSVTGALPEATRTQAEQQITAQFADSDDAFWGIKGARKPPMFRPAIITSSTTSVSNVSPTPTGLPGTDDGSAAGGTPANRSLSSGAPRMIANGRPQNRPVARRVRDADPASQPSDSNLSPWYWMMQGQGAGSIDPTGTHAFSGLLGVYPTAICWQAFHGTASPLIVIQNYKLKVWSPVVTIKINGNWDSVFQHFSASASGHYMWASADIKAEFNNMRKSGTIKTEVLVDTTLPNADAIAKRLEEKSDLVFQKFMEQAQKFIFEPPAPTVPPAEASSSGPGGKAGGLLGTPWGVSVALKYRRDENHLDLHYEETQQFAYLQDHTISSSLAGMFDEMKADPGAERKYFLTVDLNDWPRRLARVVRPVVPWNDGTVQFVTCQVGYPNQHGEINWEGHSFAQLEGNDGTWKFQTPQKEAADVAHPPQDWTPDKTFIKRQVHLAEPASELADPYKRVQIERNVIDIDAGPNGVLMNDTTLEVRADSAGRLAVGPIQLGIQLTDNSQVVEAVFEPTDANGKSLNMTPVRFRWNMNDYDRDRTWMIFTGDPQFRPFYRYQVSVTVKGTLFEPGRAWTGQWVTANGNGPLVIDIPRPGSPGVVTRSMPEERIAALRALSAQPAGRATDKTSGNGADTPAIPSATSAGHASRGLDSATEPVTFLNYPL